MRSLPLLLLLACAHKGPRAATPRPEPYWLVMNPSTPALCIPWLGQADAEVESAWKATIAHIEARDVDAARAALPAPGVHPAGDAVAGVLTMLSGEPEQAAAQLDALIDPDAPDPCLLAAAATAVGLMGDVVQARARITLARSIAPEDPEVALLFAYMTDLDQATLAIPALERGAAEQPQRTAYPVALGIASMAGGDPDAAIGWFEKAIEGGEIEVAGMLLQTYRTAGRVDDYLRMASSMGFPLGDDGLLAKAESPLASLRSLWGVADGAPITATLATSAGDLRCELFLEVAPVAVANFVGLATGTQPWTTPDGTPGEGPLYKELTFHRVIPDFMVQTGDPEGSGRGGPGYRFPDETSPDTLFDRPGRLAMANHGPDTNGSQFFVTEVAVDHLNGGYTIFGQCDEASVERVKQIARAAEPAVLHGITIGGP